MTAPPPTSALNTRVNHEARDKGEVCPPTVEDLIRRAHPILTDHCLFASPGKVSKLVRCFVRARDDGAKVPPFEQFIVKAVCMAPLRPMRGARNELNVVDEPGETVARYHDDVDPQGVAARRRAAVREARGDRRA